AIEDIASEADVAKAALEGLMHEARSVVGDLADGLRERDALREAASDEAMRLGALLSEARGVEGAEAVPAGGPGELSRAPSSAPTSLADALTDVVEEAVDRPRAAAGAAAAAAAPAAPAAQPEPGPIAGPDGAGVEVAAAANARLQRFHRMFGEK
ncbi:MAG: hypothetical protein AAFR16_15150, partial [Pseudomonadota bacterium]